MARRSSFARPPRTRSRAGRRFLVAGINEGGHQGDVDNFHDRFSAKRRAQILMGETDNGSIGSGWHTLENPPGSKAPSRAASQNPHSTVRRAPATAGRWVQVATAVSRKPAITAPA